MAPVPDATMGNAENNSHWDSPSKNNISRRMLVEKGDMPSYFLFQDNLHCLLTII